MADYLIHYNKNHSKANGQFISGDGDGDGQINDRASKQERKSLSKKTRIGLGVGLGIIGTAALVGGTIGLGKTLSDVNRSKRIREVTASAMRGKKYLLEAKIS